MNSNSGKEIRWLWMSVLVNILLCLVVFFVVFIWTGNKRFKEIDVERINIVEKDGLNRMVI